MTRTLTAKRRAAAWRFRRTHAGTLNGEHECRATKVMDGEVVRDESAVRGGQHSLARAHYPYPTCRS